MKDITTSNNVETKRKPTYKEYQNFLQNYDDNQKKTGFVILSPNSSSSSIQSSHSNQSIQTNQSSQSIEKDVSMPKTYNEYLQNYGSKKFGSVRMKGDKVFEEIKKFNDQIDGEIKKDGKKVVRSELVININQNKDDNVKTNIASKMIKSPEINKLNIKVSPEIKDSREIKFLPETRGVSPKPVDNSAVPDHMIYAKSAVLNELLTNLPNLKKTRTTTGSIYKRLEQFTLQNQNVSVKQPSLNVTLSNSLKSTSSTMIHQPVTPPLNVTSLKSSSAMIQTTKINSMVPPEAPPLPKTLPPSIPSSISLSNPNSIPTSILSSNPNSNLSSNLISNPNSIPSSISIPSSVSSSIPAPNPPSIPPPIPPPISPLISSSNLNKNLPSNSKSISSLNSNPTLKSTSKSIPTSLPTSPTPGRVQVQLKKSISNGPLSPKPPVPQKSFCIPPPPPLQFNSYQLNHSNNVNGNDQNDQNNSGNQKMLSNTKTIVPVADGNAEVDKNDPNVKKLVYNTYREMLGAYNNRANNMVSTLPRNFVVQDQGVSKQLESIGAQGCLSNLNGRVNPNPED